MARAALDACLQLVPGDRCDMAAQPERQPSALAMLATEAGSDVEPFHNRLLIVLRPKDWKAWIDLDKPEEEWQAGGRTVWLAEARYHL
jgi:hypothetical protein